MPIPMPRSRHLAAASTLAMLAGCVSITQPTPDGVTVSNPVTAQVGLRSQLCGSTFNVMRSGPDGTFDVTAQFMPPPPSPTAPSATFTNLVPGQHTLTASASTLQYWILFPYCSASSDTRIFNVAAPPAPRLGFTPAGTVNVNAGASTGVSVTVSQAQPGVVGVSLANTSPATASVPANATIAANTTASASFNIGGLVGGSTSVTASAAGLQNGTLTVNVLPTLTSVTPNSAAPGAVVSIAGQGFAAGAVARFGNTNASSSTFGSATALSATVPAVAAGPRPITVTVNGQTSATLPFTVDAAPPPAITLLFRASAQDVQTFSFSAGALALLDTDAATVQGGLAGISAAVNGAGSVLRSSASDVQAFNIVGGNSLTLAGGAPGSASGTGAAVAAVGTLAVRASDLGLDTYLLVAGVPQRQTVSAVAGTVSATGVAVDLLGSFAVRAHASGVDVYNVSNPAAPVLVGSAASMGAAVSSVGVGVKFTPAGGFAVRSHPAGIELFSIAANGMPARVGAFNTGVVSAAVNTAVAVDATGTRAVRAHSGGIEVYDITTPASPTRLGQRSGTVSTTGVGVAIVGTMAFRASNLNLEAYNIATPASIPAPVSINATVSAIGVGLAGR